MFKWLVDHPDPLVWANLVAFALTVLVAVVASFIGDQKLRFRYLYVATLASLYVVFNIGGEFSDHPEEWLAWRLSLGPLVILTIWMWPIVTQVRRWLRIKRGVEEAITESRHSRGAS